MNRNLKHLLKQYFKPHLTKIIFIIIFILVGSILSLVDPLIIRYIIDEIIIKRKISMLIFVILFSLSVKLIYHLIILLSDYLISLTTGELSKNIVLDLYNHIQSLNMRFFNNTKLGEILQRINDDTFIIAEDFFYVLVQIASAFFTLLVSLIFIFYLNVKLALISLIILPLFSYFIKLINEKYKEAVYKDRELYDKFSSFVQEKLSSIQLIKILGIESKISKQAKKIRDDIKHNTIKIYLFSNIAKNGMGFFNYLGPMIVLFYGSILYYKNQISLGGLTSFFYFISQLYYPISVLVENKLNFNKALTSIDRIYQYFDIEPEIKKQTNLPTEKFQNGDIEFINVNFSYEKNKEVFHNLTFTIKKNECVAFVGASGAGKTTITNLIFRLYEINSGEIKINNISITDFDLTELRKNIAIVSQNTVLFHASIMENLKIVNDNLTDKEIYDACKMANIHEFILSLPKGYNTIIGERGAKLSGGQRQRLSIARAILKKAKILILDEATSHLDSESEKLIKESLNLLKHKVTIIIIAHRISTIVSCDKIFILNNGSIQQIGTHEELLRTNELYQNLWKNQTISHHS